MKKLIHYVLSFSLMFNPFMSFSSARQVVKILENLRKLNIYFRMGYKGTIYELQMLNAGRSYDDDRYKVITNTDGCEYRIRIGVDYQSILTQLPEQILREADKNKLDGKLITNHEADRSLSMKVFGVPYMRGCIEVVPFEKMEGDMI